ncbi:pyridoxamine 5'-phosphate oxidase [Salibacter halophilus]|uniref:Pyridoxine/pyridoxamine 5'-phosphate oxidase n=1 Tax=Salibacter halophilus TaxID=1803916 RepID=A0A6N6M5N5_9FLAO|nr:pyridoxamine 5'-phosphate oxidase [Salibacter halophilus]KAB1064929.1 pyridoxamine 5'-phosphate oxidase [Salibacter halophilus]
MIEEVSNYLNEVRHDFSKQKLDEASVKDNPIEQYAKWFEEAVGSQVPDPKAMTLSTVNRDGVPSSRVVYTRGLKKDGLVFYTNYNSQKGIELRENPHASINIFWSELERQIRINGVVEKLSEKESDEYFASRPRESQIGAWASDQSAQLADRTELEEKVKQYEKEFEGKEVPRPKNWGGYIFKPDYFEFWQGRPSRLHDRIAYELIDKSWSKKRLSP